MKSLECLKYGHMASHSSKKSLPTGMPTDNMIASAAV